MYLKKYKNKYKSFPSDQSSVWTKKHIQKTPLKARKTILHVSAAIFFIFQTCFQYSLTVLLFLPHVCFIQKCHG